jgi:hypothetical protein
MKKRNSPTVSFGKTQTTHVGPKPKTQSLTHFAVNAINLRSPEILSISRRLTNKIRSSFESIKRRRRNARIGNDEADIILLQPDGKVIEQKLSKSCFLRCEEKTLAFICVNDAIPPSGWAHDIGDRWAIKLSLGCSFPSDIVLGVLCGWVTFGSYTEIYENLDPFALTALIKYYRRISRTPPHHKRLEQALQAQVRSGILTSIPPVHRLSGREAAT